MRFLFIFFRLLKYKAEWNKQYRECKIRRQQLIAINDIDHTIEELIIFFIPGADYFTGKENISGGLMSIISLAHESSEIHKGTATFVICSTFYNENLIYELKTFQNNAKILNPILIESYFKNIKKLILHIPEFFVENFVKNHLNKFWLNSINRVHVNILNQNIQLMPPGDVIDRLRNSIPYITMTTAHRKYCTDFYRINYGVPLHLFSTFVSPELYFYRTSIQKEKLILFSPDNNSLNLQLIGFLSKKLPNYQFQVIENISYDTYKDLISRAMFVITLGEGLDGYFVETYFSGGVAFAIKNLNFFDEKYLELPCLFDNYGKLEDLLLNLIEKYEDTAEYNQLNVRVSQLLSKDYSYQTYQNNLRKFYNQEYTYA